MRNGKKSTKVILALSLVLLVGGVCLTLAGVAMGGLKALDDTTFYGRKIHVGNQPVLTTQDKVEAFDSMNIDVSGKTVSFADSEEYYVEYPEGAEVRASVKNGKLSVTAEEGAALNYGDWGIYINGDDFISIGNGYHIDENAIIIHCPLKENYKDISITNNTGDVTLDWVKADKIDISGDTGEVYLYSVKVKDLKIDGHVLSVYGNTVDADTWTLDTDAGDVSMQINVRNKTKISMNAGDLQLDGGFLGETEIDLDTGDLDLQLAEGVEKYGAEIAMDAGQRALNVEDFGSYKKEHGAKNTLKVSVKFGDANIRFGQDPEDLDD